MYVSAHGYGLETLDNYATTAYSDAVALGALLNSRSSWPPYTSARDVKVPCPSAILLRIKNLLARR